MHAAAGFILRGGERLVFRGEARHYESVSTVGRNAHWRIIRRLGLWLVTLSFWAWPLACGSSISPTPTPQPQGPSVDIAGTWTGTLESSNLPTRTITLTVVQTGNCVDGGWLSAGSDWSGAISGFADADAYSGQVSLERQDGSAHCTAIGTVSGPVGSSSLRWTGTGFSAVGSCGGDLPQAVVITLQRR
jgi:hypothetical protein